MRKRQIQGVTPNIKLDLKCWELHQKGLGYWRIAKLLGYKSPAGIHYKIKRVEKILNYLGIKNYRVQAVNRYYRLIKLERKKNLRKELRAKIRQEPSKETRKELRLKLRRVTDELRKTKLGR